MKKIILAVTDVFACAILMSLGLECLLNLLGIAMAITLDGSSMTTQYPRFIPFCLIVGIFSLAALIGILIWIFKVSEKYAFTKKDLVVQMIIAVAISVPMIKPWEILFEYLQNRL